MKNLEGKVAFVTGGASGIGFGIVSAFLGAGMKVVIADNNREHLDQAMVNVASEQRQAHPIFVDVTDRKAIERAALEAVEVFGRIHVLVNNAGVQNPANLSNTSYAEWDRLMAINAGGVFNGIHAFLPHIKEHREEGHVVTTASMLGLFTAGENYGAYCASKAAAVAMMETLHAELAGTNIGVSILCPGPVRSNLETFLRDFELAADPLDIGQIVLRAVRNNDLYILTHPEFNVFVQRRCEAILRGTADDVQPSDARKALAASALQRSIYLAERACGPEALS